MHDLANVLRQFIVENFMFGQDDGFSNDASFLDAGIIDSTGVLELVAFLESRFDIALADEELVPENLDSIDRLATFLDNKTACLAS